MWGGGIYPFEHACYMFGMQNKQTNKSIMHFYFILLSITGLNAIKTSPMKRNSKISVKISVYPISCGNVGLFVNDFEQGCRTTDFQLYHIIFTVTTTSKSSIFSWFSITEIFFLEVR